MPRAHYQRPQTITANHLRGTSTSLGDESSSSTLQVYLRFLYKNPVREASQSKLLGETQTIHRARMSQKIAILPHKLMPRLAVTGKTFKGNER